MGSLEKFSTSGLPPRSRVEFWNDLACRTYTPITAEPRGVARFSAYLTRARVGELGIGMVHASPSTMTHSDAHVARAGRRMFFLHFQVEGRSLFRQEGREAPLGPGDFTLVDNCRPFELAFDVPCTLLVLGMAERGLRRHLGCPDEVVGVPMSYRVSLCRLLWEFAQGLWRQRGTDIAPAVAPRLTHAALDLAASAYSVLPQAQAVRSAIAQAHRMRILGYVERNLSDPELTPSTVAAAMHMTRRYLHLLFAGEGETLARYILRRRLEECARALESRSQPSRSVSYVAFEHGFSSLTHFGRVFREKYGVTPSEYRQMHIGAAAGSGGA